MRAVAKAVALLDSLHQHRSQHFERHAALAPLEPTDVGRVDAYSKGKSLLGAETSLQAKLLETSADL